MIMKRKKCFYEITKHYRNAAEKYYIEIYKSKLTEFVLEQIGEHTEGGHHYGYKITSKKIRKLPKGAKLFSNVVGSYQLW